MIVLDTNVLSETMRASPSAKVMAWFRGQEASSLFLTAVSQAEILYGIEGLQLGNRRVQLTQAADSIFAGFRERILPFDDHCAHAYSKIVLARDRLGRPISDFDAMIAAIASVHRAAIATRNTRDFERCGVTLIDPWT